MSNIRENDENTRKEDILNKLVLNRRAQEKFTQNNRLLYYNTGDKVHFKQLEFHKCTKRNRWVFGGNRTGKTECGAAETAWLLRGNHPYKKVKGAVNGWAVSVSYGAGREVAQKKLLSYLNPEWIAGIGMLKGSSGSAGGIVDYVAVKNVFGSISYVYFKSCEAGREKFQGSSLDFVWFDEEPPKDVYDECRMRVLDRKGEIYGTMTPLKGMTFVYNEIYLNAGCDDEIWCEFMEWRDNPHLDPDEIERLSKVMSASELKSRRFGEFTDKGEMVYSEFDESVNVISPFPIPPDWQDCLSIDPGLNNPLSCHWYAVDYDGNIYVVAEHFESGRTVDHHCRKILEISRELNWKTRGDGKIYALIDSAANQRTLGASKTVTELFYENGVAVNTKVDKSLFAGINRVKSYLSGSCGARLYVFNTCRNLIRELKAYKYGSDDTPVKSDDHALDELRYYVMTRPKSSPPQPDKGELYKFKQKLISKNRLNR